MNTKNNNLAALRAKMIRETEEFLSRHLFRAAGPDGLAEALEPINPQLAVANDSRATDGLSKSGQRVPFFLARALHAAAKLILESCLRVACVK